MNFPTYMRVNLHSGTFQRSGAREAGAYLFSQFKFFVNHTKVVGKLFPISDEQEGWPRIEKERARRLFARIYNDFAWVRRGVTAPGRCGRSSSSRCPWGR